MKKYKTTTCGFSGNYTVSLYRDYNTYWEFIKQTDFTTKTLSQAFKKFIKENKLNEYARIK
jgi:hypothetical protein|tara:strand:+ start:221 stop:403 length:183 start_codon:yes stop_codon:yes gene_type:complete